MPRAAINRALSAEEQALINWLIANGSSEAKAYASQVPLLRIVGACSCGCPTVDFAVSGRRVPLGEGSLILADFAGTTPEGVGVGLILHARGGQISELEVYSFDDDKGKFSLPIITSLRPI